MSAIERSRNGSHPNAVATTRIGVRPPKNPPTSPHSPGALAFFARRNRRRNARLSSGTTAMDNSDITDEESEDSLLSHAWRRRFRPVHDCLRPQNTGRLP
ncbi:hypothetical protein MHU86_9167 [Fragilaria crotonensis]|nr:hypothetical protein MHU86_9167 [Fragilaria crotonensis]